MNIDGDNNRQEAVALSRQEDRAAIQRLLRKRGACPEAIEWAADKDSFEMMWARFEQPEWMLWSLELLDYGDDPRLRLFAAACARRHTRQISDKRSVRFVEIAEAVAGGDADRDELRRACDDGEKAADDAARLPGLPVADRSAIKSACDCVRMKEMEAAQCASRNGRQASVCMIKESQWQADELRRVFVQDLPVMIERARKLLERI